MTTQSLDYYQLRANEELDAAQRASDPAIAYIHRELARRYLDKLSESDRMDGGMEMGKIAGAADAGTGSIPV